jgi:hypothetical protein
MHWEKGEKLDKTEGDGNMSVTEGSPYLSLDEKCCKIRPKMKAVLTGAQPSYIHIHFQLL